MKEGEFTLSERVKYEAPWAQVRGVFLLEAMAVSSFSFKYGTLEMGDWKPDPAPDDVSRGGDVALFF
jgi:hypothetical protein